MKIIEVIKPETIVGSFLFIVDAGDILLIVEVYKSMYGIRLIPKFNDVTEIQNTAEAYVYDLLMREAASKGIMVCMYI